MIFALIDCNNFYVSCERVFNPQLEGLPVIILSNNDGCVISRSQEAKKLGIKMGVPAFKIEGLIKKNNVRVFSSNYALYGDMSQRVMSVLAQLSPDIEIYSIDEAFLRIDSIRQFTPVEYAAQIKSVIKQWIGIPVSVGIGETKTLAKAANYLAKQYPEHESVVDLSAASEIDKFLKKIPAKNIWGVGEKHTMTLKKYSIHNAFDLKYANEKLIRQLMYVNGVRTQKELNGISCIPLEEIPPGKKNLCISRSYGTPMKDYHKIESATAAFVSRIAEKLRRQKLLASRFTVFIMTNRFSKGPRYVNFRTITLQVPTNDTSELIRMMIVLLKSIFRKGYMYKKSGVIAEDLLPDNQQQTALWDEKDREKYSRLMKAVDDINEKLGRDKMRFAIQGFDRKWKMRQEKLSGAYTSRWTDLLQIKV